MTKCLHVSIANPEFLHFIARSFFILWIFFPKIKSALLYLENLEAVDVQDAHGLGLGCEVAAHPNTVVDTSYEPGKQPTVDGLTQGIAGIDRLATDYVLA